MQAAAGGACCCRCSLRRRLMNALWAFCSKQHLPLVMQLARHRVQYHRAAAVMSCGVGFGFVTLREVGWEAFKAWVGMHWLIIIINPCKPYLTDALAVRPCFVCQQSVVDSGYLLVLRDGHLVASSCRRICAHTAACVKCSRTCC
jgi:hypothetical protein